MSLGLGLAARRQRPVLGPRAEIGQGNGALGFKRRSRLTARFPTTPDEAAGADEAYEGQAAIVASSKEGFVGSESWHESYERLSPLTRDLHRAFMSLGEELDAVDWYQQRVDATSDAELKAILAHNRDEEKEHASMVLEWIRRHDPAFHAAMETYLFTEGDVTKIEEEAEQKGETPKAGLEAGSEPAARSGGGRPETAPATFTVGSLKER